MGDLLAKGGLQPRDLVDLLEAQDLEVASGRPLTQDEWTEIWARDRRWNGDWMSGPRRAFFRIKRRVEELLGLELGWETRDGQLQLHVAIAELAAALAPYRDRAYALVELRDAAREERDPDLPLHVQVAADYRDKARPFRVIKRKYGWGAQRIRQVLEAQKVKIRHRGHPSAEDRAGPELAKKALDAHEAGGTLTDVARILGCSREGARNFLRQHRRDTRRLEKPSKSPDPPGVPAVSDPDEACERSAMCA